MTTSHPDDDSSKMAISYANTLPTDHSQTLPSFRELLPPHLHDEIDSTSYFTSPRQRSSFEFPGRQPLQSPPKMPLNDAPRDYSLTPIRASDSGDHSSLPPRFPGNGSPVAPGSTPRYAATSSRGPSPILPPIRDLHSLPDRSLTSGSPFSDGRPTSRPDPFLPDYRSTPMDVRGPWDRRNGDSASYMGTSGPAAMMHSHPAPYGYPMAYPSDSEQHSPQLVSHAQSNFGIMGDQADSRNRRRRGNLPKPVTDILRAWFHEHLDHPYPSEEDKQMFMTRTGLSISQISNWFINARRRQLPALRNQMRSGASDMDSQRQSPFSDMDQTSSESMPSPHR
ncbi:homeobox domain-containing protein [Aspergillus glaucus CBS 516.65]|uniref:Homeobox domain-containing protein n=1 Tax=Aspergillus glaucus CBS 516.65 TaxID=1160497 RepID=A0A1L9VYS4_ASPGL|nr:hypothetical protein ASPGLDRAFT_115662 [Aspergillus glaucus CBS 516.65]OJJ89073.1 hypothetical protein ASPGLDRAFT_115662 [Aspergillus glaucus CBS 516.65]